MEVVVWGGEGATIVNRSVCLLGSVLCTLVLLPVHFTPLCISVSPVLNMDRESKHEGPVESQGSQILLLALCSDNAIIHDYKITYRTRHSVVGGS